MKPTFAPLVVEVLSLLLLAQSGGQIKEGGPIGPAGQEVTCDLPQELRQRNRGGRDGAGCCVFASIQHAGRWQNQRELFDFLDQVARHERGGGWPSKVDAMMKKYAPGISYVQNTDGDLDFLRAALRSGRMPAITYDGRDVHYRGRIAHMVNTVHADEPGAAGAAWWAVLDNNFVGQTQLVWLTEPAFKSRFMGNRGGWSVVLIGPPPVPVPSNREDPQ